MLFRLRFYPAFLCFSFLLFHLLQHKQIFSCASLFLVMIIIKMVPGKNEKKTRGFFHLLSFLAFCLVVFGF